MTELLRCAAPADLPPYSLSLQSHLASAYVRRISGVTQILAHEGLLREFAASTGQHTAMHGLRYKLEHEYSRRKTPHLLCLVKGDAPATLTMQSLLGCVLLFEYRIASWNTGFFATGDRTGFDTVIAHPEIRTQVAVLAACFALEEGRMVLTCFRGRSPNISMSSFRPGQKGLWAAQERPVHDNLPLSPTLDATLNTLGRRTRNHLRYYRKRALAETGCIFVPDAAALIHRSELPWLNASSLEPVPQRAFDSQYLATAQLAGGFVCGLRAVDGLWLSLAGGWRQGTTTVLQWQRNTAGFRTLSLVTAFRAFLIEHEISLGTDRLCFHGGTSHSISHSFVSETAVDLILRRRGLFASFFAHLIPFFAERGPALANRGNFLVDALRTRELYWSPLP